MLVDHPAEYLLLGTAEGVLPGDLDTARRTQMRIPAIEPPDAQMEGLYTLDRGRDETLGRIVLTPWIRLSPAWLSAAEPQEALGQIQSVDIESTCRPGEGSLYGRLFDAMDLLLYLMGLPDQIDAALTGPLGEVPDALPSLTGHLTAHLRFGHRASAVIRVSDRAAQWRRRVTAQGNTGELELEDDHYRLYGPNGKCLDESAASSQTSSPDGLIAAQWKRWIEHAHTPAPIDPRAIVACCQTALLSCKTGNTESTDTLLRMHGG